MEGGYAVWMGQPVILRVVTGNLRVPLRGRLVSETDDVGPLPHCRQLGRGYFQVHGRWRWSTTTRSTSSTRTK